MNAFNLDRALDKLEVREQNIARTRLVAARFCLGVAMLTESEGLLKDVLNQFEMTASGETTDERKTWRREYGFWLDGAQELRFPDGVLPAPRAAAITVHTDSYHRGDDDGVTLALHTEPGRYAMRVQMQAFCDLPQWWLDFGETQENVGEHFQPDGEETMKKYTAGETASVAALEVVGGVVMSSLNSATWHETLNIRGDLF